MSKIVRVITEPSGTVRLLGNVNISEPRHALVVITDDPVDESDRHDSAPLGMAATPPSGDSEEIEQRHKLREDMRVQTRACVRCEEQFVRGPGRFTSDAEGGWKREFYKLCPECRPRKEPEGPEDLVITSPGDRPRSA